MASYNYLLDKWKISDFILRGEYGAAVLDLILEYAKLANSQKIKLEAELQGLSLDTLQTLLELNPEELNKFVSEELFSEEFLEELPPEYTDLKQKVVDLRQTIANTDEETEKQRLQQLLTEAEASLNSFRQTAIQNQLMNNPEFLFRQSKFLLTLIKAINKPVNIDQNQRQYLLKIRREIETNFLVLKGYSFEEADKIAKGLHPLALTQKEFLDLLTGIIENDELLNSKKSFFTFIQN